MKIIFLSPHQIIIAFIALVFITDRLYRFIKKERRQSFLKLVASMIIWLTILILAFIPSFEAFILIGFTVVFMVIYKLLSVIEQLDKNITELVRKEALRDLFIDNNTGRHNN